VRCFHYLADVLDEDFFWFFSSRVRHLKRLPKITEHSRADPKNITANELHQKHIFKASKQRVLAMCKYIWEYLYLNRRLQRVAEMVDSFL